MMPSRLLAAVDGGEDSDSDEPARLPRVVRGLNRHVPYRNQVVRKKRPDPAARRAENIDAMFCGDQVFPFDL